MKATVIDRTSETLVNGSVLPDIFRAGMACGDAVAEMVDCIKFEDEVRKYIKSEETKSIRMLFSVDLHQNESATIEPALEFFAPENSGEEDAKQYEIVQVVGAQVLSDKGWHAVGRDVYFEINDDKTSFRIITLNDVLKGILPVTIIYKSCEKAS